MKVGWSNNMFEFKCNIPSIRYSWRVLQLIATRKNNYVILGGEALTSNIYIYI